jgi:hypothetical protein
MKKILEDIPLTKHLEAKLHEFKITHDPLDNVIAGLQKVTDITNMVAPGEEAPKADDSTPAPAAAPSTTAPTVTEAPVEKTDKSHDVETEVGPKGSDVKTKDTKEDDASLAKKNNKRPKGKSFVQLSAVDDNPDNLETAPILAPNAYGYDLPLDMRLLQIKAIDDNPDNLETAPILAPNAYGYDLPLDMRLV